MTAQALEKILKKTGLFLQKHISTSGLKNSEDLLNTNINISITGDSRYLQTNDIFCLFQLKGLGFGQISKNQHNYEYLSQALAKKPACVIGDIPFAKAVSYGLDDTPYLEIENLSFYLGDIARMVYGLNQTDYLKEFDMLAITGTNGKTSISQFFAQLNILKQEVAVIGTLGAGFLGELKHTGFTTPDALMLQKQLQRLSLQTDVCALELSSHGLDQKRANACTIDTAIFSNLTQDHFDYHLHADNYLNAKALLFREGALRCAILNIDDAASFEILKVTQARHIVLTSVEGALVQQASNQIEDVDKTTSLKKQQPPELIIEIKSYLQQAAQELKDKSNEDEKTHKGFETQFSYIYLQSYAYDFTQKCYVADIYLEWRGHIKYISLKLPVLGLFNLSNIMQAFAGMLSLFEKKYIRRYLDVNATVTLNDIHQQNFLLKEMMGQDLDHLIQKLQAKSEILQTVSGRMEIVKLNGSDASYANTNTINTPLVVVDYAHTPDALEKTLSTLRALKKHQENSTQRLICVFGCGGNRDATKRPIMGQIAAKLADHIIITDDNPRFEAPEDITAQIEKGILEWQISTKNIISYQIIHSREDAITKAILSAKAGDIILIAGKGHEDYQEIKGQKTPFSDQKIAQTAMQKIQKI